ncbi:MAG: hypothetical protein GKC05_02395 [Methanomicrobiales archaeon]|nr:hypothetical protein [Methanomicrobiales archaeon]NYT21239.1 hypothetical protein [Methanomicrobiales archaeon]
MEPEDEAGLPQYQTELEAIEESIRNFEEGRRENIAVISEPFAGRGKLIDEIRKVHADKITSVRFNSTITSSEFLSSLREGKDIIILENCHFLVRRKIGGFDQIDAFLRYMASSGQLFITTWNSFAWSYLSAVISINSYFQRVVRLYPLGAEALQSLILSSYPYIIRFAEDRDAARGGFSVSMKCIHLRLPFSSTVYCLPWPDIRVPHPLKRRKLKGKDLFFKRLADISGGNPGVARRLFELALKSSPELLVSAPEEPKYTIDLGVSDRFLLSLILTMESVAEDDLSEIAGPDIDVRKSLYLLSSSGLITEEDGDYGITPEALKSVVQYLELTRMVW